MACLLWHPLLGPECNALFRNLAGHTWREGAEALSCCAARQCLCSASQADHKVSCTLRHMCGFGMCLCSVALFASPLCLQLDRLHSRRYQAFKPAVRAKIEMHLVGSPVQRQASFTRLGKALPQAVLASSLSPLASPLLSCEVGS